MKKTLFFLPMFLLASLTTAQQQWTLPGNGMVQIRAVVEAPSGDTYFGGLFTDSLFYTPQQALVSSGAQDAFLIKRRPTGQIAWAFSFGGDKNDAIGDLACDADGAVYLTGYAGGKLRFRHSSGDTILQLPPYQSSAYGIRLDSQGYFQAAQLLEAVQVATNGGTVVGHSIQPSGKGKGFYLACHHYGEVTAPYINLSGQAQTLSIPSASQGQESFVLEVDSNHQPHLHLELRGPNGQFIRDLALDEDRKLYVAGSFSDANTFEWQQYSSWAYPQDRDGFLACYEPNGQLQWLTLQEGIGFNSSTHIAVGPQHVYLAGIFDQELHTAQQHVYQSNGQEDIFLQAYDNNGHLNWTTSMGSIEMDVLAGLAISPKGPAALIQTQGILAGHAPLSSSQLLLQEWNEQGQPRKAQAFQSPSKVQGHGLLKMQGEWAVWGTFEQSLQGPAGQHSSPTQAGFWHQWPFCQPNSASITRYICTGDSLLLNGTWFSQAGHYQQLLRNVNGCDSNLYVHIQLLPLPQTTIQRVHQDLSLQPADSSWMIQWFWNGQAVGTGLQLAPTESGDYWALVTDSNGCVYQSSPWIFLSYEKAIEAEGLPRFFPNPNKGLLYWQHWEAAPEVLRLYDNTGRLIRQFKLAEEQQQLNLGPLPNGVYHLSWEEKGQLRSWSIKMQR